VNEGFMICLKKIMNSIISVTSLVVALGLFNSAIATASEVPYQASAKEVKKMEIFLSNFSELRAINFDSNNEPNLGKDGAILHLGADDKLADSFLTNFGVWHNYRNNYSSVVQKCKVDAKADIGEVCVPDVVVEASVKKYFDRKLNKLSADHYRGGKYYFVPADGEVCLYSRIKKIYLQDNDTLRVVGYTYNIEDETDIADEFEAVIRPYNYNGKQTWSILSFITK
jgi:hypothetical protein